MRSTINVALNKIIEDRGIYPRFTTDSERVDLFVELMESGEQFPPAKVVKSGDFYVLLDGKHRFEAHKRLGRDKIAADPFDIPKRLWRLAAARFNGKSSTPLKGKELKRVIENAWEIDKIHDTQEIAHELGCSVQYVRRVLKPIRDREREKIERKVRNMRDKGLSVRNVAERAGISKSEVHRIEGRANSANETVSPGETFSFRDTSDDVIRSNFKIINGKCNEEITPIRTPDSNHDEGVNADMQVNITAAGFVDKDADEPFPEGALDDPDYPNCIHWKPGQKETHRVFDMIYAGWSIERITKKLDVSKTWVRNTALALLTIYHYGREKFTEDEIAERFKMESSRVEYIVWLNTHFTALPPDRKMLAVWLDKYAPDYRDPEYLELMRREKIYMKCLEEGKRPPWEYQEGMPEPFSEVPREIADKFYSAVDFVNQVAELASLGLFQEENVEKDLLATFNMLLIAMNKLRDNIQSRDYFTRCSEDAMRLKAYNYIHRGDYRQALA